MTDNIGHWKLGYYLAQHKSAFCIVSSPSPPINNVGLRETCVKAEIIKIIHKGRDDVVKYYKNPIYIVQDYRRC